MVGVFIILHSSSRGEGKWGANTIGCYLGGYLVTQGVYTGVEDFKDKIARHLMVGTRGRVFPGV